MKLIRRLIDLASDHDVDMAAAGLAFYGLLGFFPALLAMVSIYGLVADPASIEGVLTSLARAIPPTARQVVLAGLADFVHRPSKSLGLSVVLGIAAVLWSASGAMSVLVRAVNVAYETHNHRSFFARRGIAVLLTLGGVLGVAVVVPVITVLPKLLHFLRADTLTTIVPWAVLVLVSFACTLALFRFAPYRDGPSFPGLIRGAAFTTVGWLVVSAGFSLYVRYLARFTSTYGALEGVIVLEFWLYVSALVLLYGAELSAELERRTLNGPRPASGSPRADSRRPRAPDFLGTRS